MTPTNPEYPQQHRRIYLGGGHAPIDFYRLDDVRVTKGGPQGDIVTVDVDGPRRIQLPPMPPGDGDRLAEELLRSRAVQTTSHSARISEATLSTADISPEIPPSK